MASDPQAFAKIAQEQGYTPEQIDAFMKKKKIGNNAAKIGDYLKKRLLELKDKYEIILYILGRK